MTPLELIRQAGERTFATEKGNPVKLGLLPGLSEPEIDTFGETLPAPLPSEIRDLLSWCRGFEGPIEAVDFTGSTMDFEMQEVFPNGLPIAADGYGNFWVVDLNLESTDWGPIYFACHDAPVILYQSADLVEFLSEVFRMAQPPYKSLIDDVHEDRLFDVWGRNPGVVTAEEAMSNGDVILAAFAKELGEGWSVVDLRGAQPGEGFSWGRYGPKTEVRRDGYRPIFAYRKPERKRFLGLFG